MHSHENWHASGEAFTLLAELVAKDECELYISEITVQEHVRHYDEKARKVDSSLKAASMAYGKLLGSNAQWNEHYCEVEMSNAPVRLKFSFEFEANSPEIRGFEVTEIEGVHRWDN